MAISITSIDFHKNSKILSNLAEMKQITVLIKIMNDLRCWSFNFKSDKPFFTWGQSKHHGQEPSARQLANKSLAVKQQKVVSFCNTRKWSHI